MVSALPHPLHHQAHFLRRPCHMQWESFSKACPEIFQVAQARFTRDQLVMVGTLRRDGWPRVSPCEIDMAARPLFGGLTWPATKALHLPRAPRATVHTV